MTYCAFIWKDADGNRQLEHFYCGNYSEYALERKQQILDQFGKDKVLWFFATNKHSLYLKYLIRAREICLKDLSKSYERYLEELVAKGEPVGLLSDVRKVQDEIEQQEIHKLGRTVSRYFRMCNSENIEPSPVSELALMCCDCYEASRR